jgi:hypothetical protein
MKLQRGIHQCGYDINFEFKQCTNQQQTVYGDMTINLQFVFLFMNIHRGRIYVHTYSSDIMKEKFQVYHQILYLFLVCFGYRQSK